MELYLDSANIKEIESAFELGFLNGLTTTPTFMHRNGISDVDQLIKKLSGIVPILQIEAMGNTAEEIINEAMRQMDLGLDASRTVFKIPVSLEGVKAAYQLRKKNLLVNIHLVYTLQQAYMAMQSGANYVCPLVGRLQDQGHDALELVKQCVFVANHYKYDTKVMFSSVRHAEHVRNALNIGVHAITVPWKVLVALTENNFTTIGTQQFFEHTRLVTQKVRDVIRPVNPVVSAESSVTEALVRMTESGLGSVAVINDNGKILGVFTDGDLRRKLQQEGRNILNHKMGDFSYSSPVAVEADALLNEAAEIFKKTSIDNILVTEKGAPVGMLDIQDLKL
jgi:transaldolase